MVRKLELLAPAKNLECGMAAVDHGADAVYIGAEMFGARAAAGNPVSDIEKLCRYAHQFGVKVYLTVNTIIYDNEIDNVKILLEKLDRVGVDAVLVQDMALAEMVREMQKNGSKMELHASTQTDNRTKEKVEWLAGLGFNRVVLARELSIEEIDTIHKALPEVELEVFVHGALCVSYSGQCYASQYCFSRSANRGECAQFCRLKFDLVDSQGKVVEHDRHLLSLKDFCQIDNLERLAEAGATSFKIEGRLKDVAYVKNVTAAYSKKLDEIVKAHPDKYCRASSGTVELSFTPSLDKTFNRGYTTYFADGRQPDIFSPDTPKALGEYVGKVKEVRRQMVIVAGVATFANGDGLCFINSERQLEGFRVNRAEGNHLYPSVMPKNLRNGMALYRNNDQTFEKTLAKQTATRTIAVDMTFREVEKGFALDCTAEDGRACRVTVDAEHSKAQKPQRENIERQLTKLGTTIFSCRSIKVDQDFCWFVPSSLLAAMRREMVEKLTTSSPQQDKAISRRETIKRQESSNALPTDQMANRCGGYLLNASNSRSVAFYKSRGAESPTAFETEDNHRPDSMLMQCRFCLRHALGYCVARGGRKPQWKEPLSLRLPDGRMFPLQFDCKRCQMNVLMRWILLVIIIPLFASCYKQASPTPDAWSLTERQQDSISFYSTHHYTQNFNFLVKGDSLVLLPQRGDEMVDGGNYSAFEDTIVVKPGSRVVVADIAFLPNDTVDSVWVKLAYDQNTQGWIQESKMLPNVKPDDPISWFIDTFSDSHLLLFLALVVVVLAAYGLLLIKRRKAMIVHWNDIDSPFPMMLVLLVSTAAVVYASIQLFDPEAWRHYYYHPSLNPFSLPPKLSLFMTLVWAILIVSLAALDDIIHRFAFGEAVVYTMGLCAVCAVDYVVFSISTLYYVGYPLLIAYFAYAVYLRMKAHVPGLRCGNCGQPLAHTGVCPHCGAENY